MRSSFISVEERVPSLYEAFGLYGFFIKVPWNEEGETYE